jgi:hypothetical protein
MSTRQVILGPLLLVTAGGSTTPSTGCCCCMPPHPSAAPCSCITAWLLLLLAPLLLVCLGAACVMRCEWLNNINKLLGDMAAGAVARRETGCRYDFEHSRPMCATTTQKHKTVNESAAGTCTPCYSHVCQSCVPPTFLWCCCCADLSRCVAWCRQYNGIVQQ